MKKADLPALSNARVAYKAEASAGANSRLVFGFPVGSTER